MTHHRMTKLTLSCAAIALVAACEGPLPDIDLRDRAGGFDTSPAAGAASERPTPDARGVITYPDYQVAVARSGDTVRSIALRLDLTASEVARANGIEADTALRAGEIVALPSRVAGQQATVPLDVTAVATTALDRVGASPQPVAAAAAPQPIRHTVARGETAFSISRLYNLPVATLASWNGLDGSLSVREGQTLLVPVGSQAVQTQAPLTAPGMGTPTPLPPSAAAPLPTTDVAPQIAQADLPPPPDLTSAAPAPSEVEVAPPPPPVPTPEPTPEPAPSSDARFLRPVAGAVIRDYNPGRNEGIDIGASAGAAVQAADRGTVAAVTEDTSGVSIVVIRHPDNLMTVYTNLDDLSVSKGDSVSRGGRIGTVAPGSPAFLHFEVREGMNAVDPNNYLPG